MHINIILVLLFSILILIFYLLNNLLKTNITENYQGLVTDQFYDELEKIGYKIDKENKFILYNDKLISYNKHFNSLDSIKNAKNKYVTSQILLKNNIPIPKFIKINCDDSIDNIYNQIIKNNIKFPVVIKPVNGTFGIDVITDIGSLEDLNREINQFKGKYKDLILEEQISGDCYRVFVFNNKVIDIINRKKPYVIGNGSSSIKELIDLRNITQKKKNLMEVNNISEVYIKKQGYMLDGIPEKGIKIYITNVINMHNGANINRIPISSVPQKNLDLFINVNKAMDINCSGLDYLSDDISIEYDKNNAKILEVNGTPDTEIHQKIPGFNFFEKLVKSIQF